MRAEAFSWRSEGHHAPGAGHNGAVCTQNKKMFHNFYYDYNIFLENIFLVLVLNVNECYSVIQKGKNKQ